MTGTSETTQPVNQADNLIFAALLILFAWSISFGLVIFLLWFSIAILGSRFLSLKLLVPITAALIVLSAGLHKWFLWYAPFLWEQPLNFYQMTYFSVRNNSYEVLFNQWIGSFHIYAIYSLVHGALAGFLAACFVSYHDLLNPVRAERRKQAKAAKTSNKPRKKPILRNADKIPADRLGETVLGNDAESGKLVTISDKSINTHVLVVGTTGGGKTVTVLNLVESFINRDLPVLYIDGQGERTLGERICNYARDHGKAGRLFSMTGDSVTYNPLYAGNFTSKKDRIIQIREWSEPHYKTLCEGYLQMVFSVLEKVGEDVNFLNVAEYMKPSRLKALIKEKVKSAEIDKETGTELQGLISEETANEKEILGLAAEIRNLARSELGHLFEVDKVENLVLAESLKRGEVVYMGLNPLQFPALAGTLGKLIVNDFKSSIDPDNPLQVLVIFDEFGVFAGDQVLNIINQGRSAGVCAVLTVQSTADIGRNIQNNSEQFIEQVFSNCNNFIVHRVNSAANAEALSAILGTGVSQQLTARVTDGQGFSGEGSFRTTREFLYHPDDIKTLGTGQAVYLNRNNGFHCQVNVRKSVI